MESRVPAMAPSPLNLPAGQLLALGSGVHLNHGTFPDRTGRSLGHMGEFLCCVQLLVLPMRTEQFPAVGKGRAAMRAVPGLGDASGTHHLCLFCCFRQSRAFVICVVPT